MITDEKISRAMTEVENKVTVTNGKGWQPPTFARPILSSQDTFDQNTQVEHISDPFALGTRPLWNVPEQAVSNLRVSTIRSSASVSSAVPTIATQSGVVLSPSTNTTQFSVVPNMAQASKTTGPVQITFSLNAKTANANDPVSFAVFRNGIQASQTYLASGGAANTAFLVTGTFTDNPPIGGTVYDLRWKKGSSLLTSIGTQRTLQVLNLRAR